MKPKLSTRDRVALGALLTGAVLTLWLEAKPLQPTEAPAKAPVVTEAPPTLQAPPRLQATERQEHICQENAYRGEPPADGDCSTMPAEIQEDDPWGRWNCATMGNRICGNQPRWLTFELDRTG
jgi:hypothetical protein